MSVYTINYDLISPGKDYKPLYEAIKKNFPDHIHPLDSMWMIESELTAKGVFDKLSPFLDRNDKLIVIAKKSGSYRSATFTADEDKWIEDHSE